MKPTAFRIMGGAVIMACFFAAVAVSGAGGCGEGKDTAVAAEIVLADGTERSLSDSPIPINVFIKLTFAGAVNPTEAESKFIFTRDGEDVPRTITWFEDNTVMLVRSKNVLAYGTEYRVAINPEQVEQPLEAPTAAVKAGIAALDETFTTMVQNDVNGDGKADLITQARAWQGGLTLEGGTGRGRGYIFYGNGIATGGAASAPALIDGEADDDQLFTLSIPGFNHDVNDDGYDDVIYASFFYSTFTGRTYIFYGGSGSEPISGALSASSADVVLTGASDNDIFLAPNIGDVNGDGFSDIVAGGRGCSNSTGCVYVFFGPDFTSETSAGADVTITGENENDLFGVIARLGDVNDDGIADIIVAAQGYPNGAMDGRIYVIYGSSTLASMGAASADVIITGETAGDRLSVQGLADFDGDGVSDILANASGYNASTGRLYLFYHANLVSEGAGDADVIITGENSGDLFGTSALWDDVTGDGTVDIIIGSQPYGTTTGRVYGFLGDAGFASRAAADADFIFTGESAGDSLTLGELGDVNGDGISDIVARAGGYAAGAAQGRVYVFLGSSSIASRGAAEADVIFTGESNGDAFGANRAIDINGDGIMDIVGVAQAYDAGALTGRIYIFYGATDLSSEGAASADVILTGENPLDRFGT